jgi:hypothetical protein
MLRRVAEIIRGWADEEPRALWERLRAERKARGPHADGPGCAAEMLFLQHGSFSGKGPEYGIGRPQGGAVKGSDGEVYWPALRPSLDIVNDAVARLAEYATIVSGNRLVNMAGPALMNTGNGGTRYGGEFATPVGDVAAAFERVAGEVAAASYLHQGSFQYKGPDAGIGRPEGMEAHGTHGAIRPVVSILGDAFPRLALGWPPVLVLPAIPEAADVAAWLGTPGDLDDCVVYMDPPYAGTTGYAATLGRDEVVRHARAYAELGAVVAISEAEVVIPEWDAVEITAGRKGQKRTFSKQQAEWLTMNRAPAHRVAVQAGLFAVGA